MAGLSHRQFILVAACGAALWYLAAVLTKTLGPMGVYDGMSRVWLYLAVIPGTVPFVYLIAKVAGLARDQIAAAMAIATATALVLDGVAVAWAPQLYGDETSMVLSASAVILWGAGVAIALGFLFNKRIA